MIDLGTVKPGSTIRIPYSTFDKDDGSAITQTNYAAADILVYKDGGTTERASTAGFTATTDFDSKTGKQLAVIDLADNTTSGFFNAGSEYLVAIDSVTVDAVTTGGWIARFRIGYPNAVLDTTIASLTNQTSFTLTAGPAEDDAINGYWAIIHDIASAVQCSWVEVLDYTGSTKTVTLAAGATFTAAAGDNISLMGPSPLRAATTGRTAAVDASGQVTVGAIANNAITAASIASNAITAAKVATDAIGAAQLAADAVTEIQSGLGTSANQTTILNRIGTPTDLGGGASLSANLVDIESQTDDIGAAGAGLTAIPNSAGVTTLLTRMGTPSDLGSGASVAANLADIEAQTDDIGAAGAGLTAITGVLGTPAGASMSADIAAVKSDSAAILDDTGTSGVVVAAASKTGFRLSATGVADIWAYVVEGTWTAVMYMRLMASALLGKLSGAGTTTVTIRDVDDTKDRIVATVDASGNRSDFGTRDGT